MSFFDFLLIIAALVFAWFCGILSAFWSIQRRAPAVYKDVQKAFNSTKGGGSNG